jgi:hypothetical protein
MLWQAQHVLKLTQHLNNIVQLEAIKVKIHLQQHSLVRWLTPPARMQPKSSQRANSEAGQATHARTMTAQQTHAQQLLHQTNYQC